jgi:hypothetical protein
VKRSILKLKYNIIFVQLPKVIKEALEEALPNTAHIQKQEISTS